MEKFLFKHFILVDEPSVCTTTNVKTDINLPNDVTRANIIIKDDTGNHCVRWASILVYFSIIY